MTIEILYKIIIWFMVYSIIGWMYETLICSVSAKKFLNRGFLNGPYCPIYGFGAIFDILILGKIKNIFLLFIRGVIITCSLEYLTSYIMEKLFHARWWDYSDRKFNINGRVCLLGAIVFGIFSVILIKIIHPTIMYFTDMLPKGKLYFATALFTGIFIFDIIVTISGFSNFNKKLVSFSKTIEEKKTELTNKIHTTSAHNIMNSIYENYVNKMNNQQSRMIKAFPKLHSTTCDNLLMEIKKVIHKKKQ